MQRFRIAILIVAMLAAPIFSHSVAAQKQSPADAAAEFVVGNCYRSLDDISRVKSMARVLKWQPLSADMANAMKPVDAQGYEAWHVIRDGQHFFVGVNTGQFKGRPVEVCSIVANHSPKVLVPLVLKAFRARLVGRNTAGFQISETYDLEHPTQPKAMLMITRAPDDQPPVSFGFLGFR